MFSRKIVSDQFSNPCNKTLKPYSLEHTHMKVVYRVF